MMGKNILRSERGANYMRVAGIDHLVLTVTNIEKTCAFYSRVLGMQEIELAGGRKALLFGKQKLNLHQVGQEIRPYAKKNMPGAADICFIANCDIVKVLEHLKLCGVTVEEGPVDREGAAGRMRSVYIRDPDGNLVEIASYLS